MRECRWRMRLSHQAECCQIRRGQGACGDTIWPSVKIQGPDGGDFMSAFVYLHFQTSRLQALFCKHHDATVTEDMLLMWGVQMLHHDANPCNLYINVQVFGRGCVCGVGSAWHICLCERWQHFMPHPPSFKIKIEMVKSLQMSTHDGNLHMLSYIQTCSAMERG